MRTGMLNGAVELFRQLGYEEVPDSQVDGNWGSARFVRPVGKNYGIIQLTELESRAGILENTDNHVGVEVPQGVAAWQYAVEVEEFLDRAGVNGTFTEAANPEGTKVFLHAPGLLTFGIEFVEVVRVIPL